MAAPRGRRVRREHLGILLAFLAYASWGLLSPVGAELLHDHAFGPLELNAVRFVLATIPLLLVLGPAASMAGLRILGRREILVPNILANASLTLFLYSLEHVEPTFATLAFYTAPLFTAALAWALLRERMGWAFLPAAAGLMAGGYLALFGLAAPSGASAWGLGLSVASAVVWAAFSVALRKAAPSVPLKPLVASAFIAGTLWYVPLALAFEGIPDLAAKTAASWAWMALYVAIPTLASFLLFNASLRLAPAGAVNLLVGAELAFTALFAALLFGARFDAVQLAGLGLVLASVTAYLWVRERRPHPQPDTASPPSTSPSLIKPEAGIQKR